jgi:hypothetical protein
MSSKHINLEPRNEQGEPHGYWDTTFSNRGWYKGHFVNHMAKGYFEIDWFGTGNTECFYYAG